MRFDCEKGEEFLKQRIDPVPNRCYISRCRLEGTEEPEEKPLRAGWLTRARRASKIRFAALGL